MIDLKQATKQEAVSLLLANNKLFVVNCYRVS